MSTMVDHTPNRAFPDRLKPLLSHCKDFAETCGSYIETSGYKSIFVLSAPALAEKTPALPRLEKALSGRVKGTFLGIGPHTPIPDVLMAVEEIRKIGDIDCLITLGGGSVTDAGKLLRFFLANAALTEDQIHPIWGNKEVNPKWPARVLRPTLPLIHIPTTLSGGEFQHIAGGTFQDSGIKQLFEPGVEADLIIQDPNLCTTTPSSLWISSGVRSLDHCVEALCSLQGNQAGNESAERGLKILLPGLLACIEDPSNPEARSQCQQGLVHAVSAMCSGVPLGASHAIGHQLGPLGVGHGETSCVLLPAVCKFNAARGVNVDQQRKCLEIFCQDKKVRKLLNAQGMVNFDLGDVLDVIIRALGMPRSLREVSVHESLFDRLAVNTLHDPWAKTNPFPLTDKDSVLQILSMAA